MHTSSENNCLLYPICLLVALAEFLSDPPIKSETTNFLVHSIMKHVRFAFNDAVVACKLRKLERRLCLADEEVKKQEEKLPDNIFDEVEPPELVTC